MWSDKIILGMIIVCGILTVVVTMGKPLLFLMKFAGKMVFGSALIYIINILMAFSGVKVGINLVTAFLSALLGFSGIAALYITQIIIM